MYWMCPVEDSDPQTCERTIGNESLGNDFSHAAFREEREQLQRELGTVLATKDWYAVTAAGPRAPIAADTDARVVVDVLSVQPTFSATHRATVPDVCRSAYEEVPVRSNAKVRRDAEGRVRAAAGGQVVTTASCGMYTSYTDWLVIYDASGHPERFFVTGNTYGDDLVYQYEAIGRVETVDGRPVALDVRSRGRFIGCELCSNELLGTDGPNSELDWDEMTWKHDRYTYK